MLIVVFYLILHINIIHFKCNCNFKHYYVITIRIIFKYIIIRFNINYVKVYISLCFSLLNHIKTIDFIMKSNKHMYLSLNCQ